MDSDIASPKKDSSGSRWWTSYRCRSTGPNTSTSRCCSSRRSSGSSNTGSSSHSRSGDNSVTSATCRRCSSSSGDTARAAPNASTTSSSNSKNISGSCRGSSSNVGGSGRDEKMGESSSVVSSESPCGGDRGSRSSSSSNEKIGENTKSVPRGSSNGAGSRSSRSSTERKVAPGREDQTGRYSRLLALQRMGVVENYAAISEKTVAVVGVGGVGAVAAEMLTRCGVGRLLLFDYDRVEEANMNRLFFQPHQIGSPKVRAARETLHAINPEVDIEAFDCDVCREFDVLLNCLAGKPSGEGSNVDGSSRSSSSHDSNSSSSGSGSAHGGSSGSQSDGGDLDRSETQTNSRGNISKPCRGFIGRRRDSNSSGRNSSSMNSSSRNSSSRSRGGSSSSDDRSCSDSRSSSNDCSGTREEGSPGRPAVDLLLSCVDNYAARITVSQACNETGVAWMNSGVSESATSGQIQTCIPGLLACFQCAPPYVVATGEDERAIRREGVCAASLPTTMAIVAGLLVQNALKYLLHFGEVSPLLCFNSLQNFFYALVLQPSPFCADPWCQLQQKRVKEKGLSAHEFLHFTATAPPDSNAEKYSEETFSAVCVLAEGEEGEPLPLGHTVTSDVKSCGSSSDSSSNNDSISSRTATISRSNDGSAPRNNSSDSSNTGDRSGDGQKSSGSRSYRSRNSRTGGTAGNADDSGEFVKSEVGAQDEGIEETTGPGSDVHKYSVEQLRQELQRLQN